ncbi:MAG: hypothetical protein ABSB49_21055 [Polyangia bacterium]
MLKKILLALLAAAALTPGLASAQIGPQPPTPMVVDLKKVEVGSWAAYTTTLGQTTTNTKLAMVARDASSVSMETLIEVGKAAMMRGKMTMKIVVDPDPTSAAKPIKQVVMQMGDRDPMLAPDNMPQKFTFTKPDPHTLVGKETLKVAAGSFRTSHYRTKNEQGTADVWVSEDVPPSGLVKFTTSWMRAGGQQLPGITMELTALGKGAKPTITKKPKPFDPQMLMGDALGPGGRQKSTP